jgi:hypothetical protein
MKKLSRSSRSPRARIHRHGQFRARFETLETRLALTAPAAPVIIEPLTEGQVVSKFDVHMEIDPNAYFDADGDAHSGSSWQIRETPGNGGAAVWQALGITDPLSKNHIHLGDGTFVGTLGGLNSLNANHDYVLTVFFTDSAGETSTTSVRNFKTASDSQPVPGLGEWIAHEGYVVEPVATAGAFRLPVNIAFVPNPGPNPDDPFYYVAELYGSIKVVSRSGQVTSYADSLLDYNPTGQFSGTGEQGLTGMAVDPVSGDLFVSMLWDNGTTDAQRGGSTLHFPKVERLHSTDGGRTMATRSIVLNMQPEVQGQSHQISNVSIGPDGKLYVHMGDGFVTSTALDLNSFRGKTLRMNFDGTAPSDNPFYNAADGISARDYVFTYGHRNPFGGAWRALDGKQYIVENGNGIDRLAQLNAGQSYGWDGSDTPIANISQYVWSPANAPINIAFVQPQTFGGSLFPAGSQNDAFVSLSAATYSSGPQDDGKRIDWFPDLDSRDANGKLTTAPITLVQYNGTGRATIAGLAAGPDGIYFTDLYRDDGVGGPTAIGANVYRLRYVDFAPENVTAVPSNSQVTLNWISDPLAASHNIYRESDGVTALIASNVTGSSYTDTTAVNDTHYHYFLRGVNAGGESSDSNEVHGDPSAALGFPPTIATPASATPTAIVGTTTQLKALGADDGGEANLTYTWSLIGATPAPVTFSINGTNAAKNTVATFSGAGAYRFAVTVRDANGLTATSTVDVTVSQTFTSISVSPTGVSVFTGSTRQFKATALDQFGVAMTTQPGFTWSLVSGSVGSINATSGLFTAGNSSGSATAKATSGAITATGTASVIPAIAGTGLTGTYYNNSNLTGTTIVRNDATVNFDWGSGSPNGFIDNNTFSARWLGAIAPRYSETYTFIATADDGVRLWIGNQLIIDQWKVDSATQYTGTIKLVAGEMYPIRLEYQEMTGLAVMKLEWRSTSQAREIVPQSRLFRTTPIKVNFEPAGAAVPTGYLADTGRAFADRGNGYSYGWNGNNTAGTRDRDDSTSLDQRYDTFAHMQKPELPNAFWEIAVPNGMYRVHIVSGDPGWFDSVFRTNVEGVSIINSGPTSSQRYSEGWADVIVTDGRLTVSNAAGAVNNKINFIDVLPLGLDLSAGFGAATNVITKNGTAKINGSVLQLTDGNNMQAGSAFFPQMNVSRFTTQFDFRLSIPNADGFTFAIQATGPNALGDTGGGLGYGLDPNYGINGIPKSVAVKFDLYNNNGEGFNSTGLYVNGQAPSIGGIDPFIGSHDLTTSDIDLHSGRTFRATITYDSAQLVVSITDLMSGAIASQYYDLNLISILGTNQAFVGFTGGTGGLAVNTEILNWSFFPT